MRTELFYMHVLVVTHIYGFVQRGKWSKLKATLKISTYRGTSGCVDLTLFMLALQPIYSRIKF